MISLYVTCASICNFRENKLLLLLLTTQIVDINNSRDLLISRNNCWYQQISIKVQFCLHQRGRKGTLLSICWYQQLGDTFAMLDDGQTTIRCNLCFLSCCYAWGGVNYFMEIGGNVGKHKVYINKSCECFISIIRMIDWLISTIRWNCWYQSIVRIIEINNSHDLLISGNELLIPENGFLISTIRAFC